MTIRYKVVPPARGQNVLFEAVRALPLVPGDEDDCCARIRDRTAVESRAEARQWLTFAVALGLAAETDRGFHRIRDAPDSAVLADRLRARVYPTRELLGLLDAEGTLSALEAFERLRDDLPQWERSRRTDWDAEWRERIEHLLDWCVIFGLVERTDGGYLPGNVQADAERID
ncbi:MAG: hypothetical protein ABEH64_02885 [Salinirussus sp.]